MSIAPVLSLRTLSLPPPGRYRLDAESCVAEVSARHRLVSTLRRRVAASGGVLVVDADDPLASWVCVDLDARDIDRSEIDADRYPFIRFESTLVDEVGPSRFVVRGDLYVGDVVADVALDARMIAVDRRRVSFAATATVDIQRLGLRPPPLVGRTMRITVGADFVKGGSAR